jgi:hypothetical protein
MRLIQLSGIGRVGKTTVADMICKAAFKLGYRPVIVPFAQAIKMAAVEEGITKEANSQKYRDYCQKIGAEKRQLDSEYWVNKTDEIIKDYMVKEIDNKKLHTNWEYVIVQDDVRYMNELAYGRNLAAIQLFVHAGDRVVQEYNAEWRKHESETLANQVVAFMGLPNSDYDELFDVFIENSGTLADLEQMINENIKDCLDSAWIELEEIEDGSNS